MASVGGPILIVKGCRRCLVSTAEENFQGKTGQRESAANFLPAQERQHKKEAAIAHGVHGGRRDYQGLPVLTASFDKFQGETGQGGRAAVFLLAHERVKMPAQQGQKCPCDKGNDAGTMPATWATAQCWQ